MGFRAPTSTRLWTTSCVTMGLDDGPIMHKDNLELPTTTLPSKEPEGPPKPEPTRAEQRAMWVRGFDHVLPIDAEKGNWHGPIDKLVELLEVDKLDVNERDSACNLTPLMKAAARNHVEAIKVLLDHGADLELTDNSGFTALHKCSGGKTLGGQYKLHAEARALLLERGAKDTPMPKQRIFIYDPPDNSRWEDVPEEEEVKEEAQAA